MQKIKESFAAKLVAVLLFAVFLLLAAASGAGMMYATEENMYNGSGNFYNSQTFNRIINNDERMVMDAVSSLSGVSLSQAFPESRYNFSATIADESGRVIAQNYALDTWAYETTDTFSDQATDTVTIRVKGDLTAPDDLARAYRLYNTVWRMRVLLIVLCGVFLLLGILDFVFLLSASGHHKGKEGVTPTFADKIPLDVVLAAAIPLVILFLTEIGEVCDVEQPVTFFPIGLLLAAAGLTALAVCMTMAVRAKLGTFFKNTVIYLVLRWLFRLIGRIIRALPLVWKCALASAALILLNSILWAATVNGNGFAGFLLFLFYVGVFAATVVLASDMLKLKNAGKEIAAGNLEYKVDTRKLYLDFKEHGENLNAITDGMARAVEERMKSERMKTELITNVSHDIKTPLTSIINYVDLLEKEHTPEAEEQYIRILKRQSLRMKKLTEDIVEASKASTGSLPVSLAPTSVREIVEQAVGEYGERLEATKLEAVCTVSDGLTVLADGRLLWRIMDNLLNNACKYSMPGTRVYVDGREEGGKGLISVKNISREKLNMSAEELMERFVRGDASRNTEGSGLGLNIAKSLAELQHALLTLEIDGDLFKASLHFNLAEMKKAPQAPADGPSGAE